jgi:hypothetical protein
MIPIGLRVHQAIVFSIHPLHFAVFLVSKHGVFSFLSVEGFG